MRRFRARPACPWALALLAVVVFAGPAVAHAPFFDQRSCPMGHGLTLRLMHGDGIIGANPQAAVITDAEGRLRAYQPMSTRADLLCRDGAAVDWDSGRLWTPQPEDFFVGPVVTGSSDTARNTRWAYEPGSRHEGVGFVSGRLSFAQFWSAFVEDPWPLLVPTFLFSLAGAGLGALWGLCRREAHPLSLWLIAVPVVVLCCAAVTLISVAVIFGVPPTQGEGSLWLTVVLIPALMGHRIARAHRA